MSHFKHIDFNNKKEVKKIAETFEDILNDIWCNYSLTTGRKKFDAIAHTISSPFDRKIFTEICHVQLGNGQWQARLAVKDEMEHYLKYLLSNKT